MPAATTNLRRLEAMLRELGDRLTKLESATPDRAAGARSRPPVPRHSILDGLRRRAGASPGSAGRAGGRVGFGGIVFTAAGRHYEWQGEREVGALTAMSWETFATSLGALGHPVRLELLRAIVAGHHDVGQMSRIPGMGSTGQLYHHLRQLQSGGWVRQTQRNHYVPVPDRLVALLAILAAITGPAEDETPAEPASSPRAAPRRKKTAKGGSR
jgi:hypothetical protein